MVGAPKSLSDLHRIEAQVQVTCRSCKASEVWELTALIEEVRRKGGKTDWRAARRSIKCPKRCPSPMIDLLPIPYGKERALRRAHRHALIYLALEILREAASRSGSEAVGTVEVRLALHVLRPFVREQRLLNEYWRAATVQPRHPWTSCQLAYRSIVQRLNERGAIIDQANVPCVRSQSGDCVSADGETPRPISTTTGARSQSMSPKRVGRLLYIGVTGGSTDISNVSVSFCDLLTVFVPVPPTLKMSTLTVAPPSTSRVTSKLAE